MHTTRRHILKGAACVAGALAFPSSGQSVAAKSTRQPARYWQPLDNRVVRCGLCPHRCTLGPDQTGICRVRRNDKGQLFTLGYANPCAVHVDPIEKKPLFHFLPATRAYSIAVAGCNMRCKNCQNWTISQSSPLETRNEYLPPDKVVAEAKRAGCLSIAYTYSEPTVWFEYMIDTCKAARAAGIRNVLVSCGYINQEPLRELTKYMDAATYCLKSFDDDIYQRLNAGRLQPVLDTIITARKSGIWVEVSNLVVPQWTDDPGMIRRMCAWLRENVGADTPLHFLRFHPDHQLMNLFPTPTLTMQAAATVAREEKMKYVYLGNVAEADLNTYCPSCGKAVVKRNGYLIGDVSIRDGKCGSCGAAIAGVWRG